MRPLAWPLGWKTVLLSTNTVKNVMIAVTKVSLSKVQSLYLGHRFICEDSRSRVNRHYVIMETNSIGIGNPNQRD